jgi:hypothetical protein
MALARSVDVHSTYLFCRCIASCSKDIAVVLGRQARERASELRDESEIEQRQACVLLAVCDGCADAALYAAGGRPRLAPWRAGAARQLRMQRSNQLARRRSMTSSKLVVGL